MFYFLPPRLSLSFNWLPIQQMQRLMPLRPLPRCRNMTCENKLTFLDKFLYRWVAERCKRKQKSNKYSVVIVEWHTRISPFERHGLPSKPSFRRAVPWRNHHRRDKYCGETTLFFTVEILPKEFEFQVQKKECSKFAKPNQCVFIICQCV